MDDSPQEINLIRRLNIGSEIPIYAYFKSSQKSKIKAFIFVEIF